MPAYNEGERLTATLEGLARGLGDRARATTVFVVDDGSVHALRTDSLRQVTSPMRVVVARHPINLGQGAALETARRMALHPQWQPADGPFDVLVTMDSDGQHQPHDVLKLVDAIEGGADVALGDRFAGGSNVPSSRRIVLHLARFFERALTGLALADAHNGLRAFRPRAMAAMRIRQNRMAHATELLQHIARAAFGRPAHAALSLVEVPVSVVYNDEVRAKGQRASGAVAIVVDLMHAFLFGAEPSEPV